MHKNFEVALKENRELPPDLSVYQGYLDEIRKVSGQMRVEVKLAIDTSLQPCDFFAEHVFMRCVVDVLHLQETTALAMDHKTGKPRPSNQLRMTALIVFHCFPQINTCKTGYFYLKFNKRVSETYTRMQVPELWQEFLPDLQQYRAAFEQDVWQPRQSGLCNGWCPCTECEYWKPKGASRRR